MLTPLVCRAVAAHRIGVLKSCIGAKGDVALRGGTGLTVLHTAVRERSLDMVLCILESTYVDCNAADPDGVTPLQLVGDSYHTDGHEVLAC